MSDEQLERVVDTVVRSLATAARTLRLYPATSPIPRQTAEAAVEALGSYFVDEPVLPLVVAREGFRFRSASVNAPGSNELADMLIRHGVAEISILPAAGIDELITFVGAVLKDPTEIRDASGLGAVLAAYGIESVSVSDVALTVVELTAPEEGEDLDEFLRDLASDPDKLALWLASATAGDPAALAEGLAELACVAGPGGLERLVAALTSAFMRQQPEGRDALMGLSVKDGDVRSLMSAVFGSLGTADIAQSLAGGLFGKNVLSMSNMLAALPLGSRMSQVLAEVKPLLASAGHTDHEMAFLEHMLELRGQQEREAPLIDRRPDYAKVAQIADVRPEELSQARKEVQSSMSRMNARSVTTMLQLLDQQEDFSLYCKTLDGLASIVPALFEMRDLDLADEVLRELANREARTDQAWPELTEKIREAIAKAGEVLGRRLLDLLIAEAPDAQWFNIAPIVQRLASEGDARSTQTIDSILRRPDERSRQEAAKGLAGAGSPMALRQLASLMRDPSSEVALVAIRAAGRSAAPGTANVLGERFSELDCDGKDFTPCREIINSLARSAGPDASAVLSRIAARRALIKRGHFAEIADLSGKALTTRSAEAER